MQCSCGLRIVYTLWSKGYTSEAVGIIINFIFSDDFHFYVHRVEALILPSNQPSEKLLKSLGFSLEGILHGKCYWNSGFHDMKMYGILRNEHLK